MVVMQILSLDFFHVQITDRRQTTAKARSVSKFNECSGVAMVLVIVAGCDLPLADSVRHGGLGLDHT